MSHEDDMEQAAWATDPVRLAKQIAAERRAIRITYTATSVIITIILFAGQIT